MGNLAGKSCGTRKREKSLFKKGSDWWKFSIWNRVKGSQQIRIQLGKILWENLVGNSCRKFLWDKEEGKRLLKKGSGWWKFSIWNRVMGSQPIRIQLGKILQDNHAGNSCGKILAGKSCGKILLREDLCGKILVGNCCEENLAVEIVAGKSCRKIIVFWK